MFFQFLPRIISFLENTVFFDAFSFFVFMQSAVGKFAAFFEKNAFSRYFFTAFIFFFIFLISLDFFYPVCYTQNKKSKNSKEK